MTERLLLVAAIATVVAVAIWLLRRRPTSRTIPAPGLADGLYLFTSEGCETCEPARAALASKELPFDELRWPHDRAEFERLGIDAVPSVLVVGRERGRLFRGGVPRGLGRRQIPGRSGDTG